MMMMMLGEAAANKTTIRGQQEDEDAQAPRKPSIGSIKMIGESSTIVDQQQTAQQTNNMTSLTRLVEKSVIIHKDENGFGLRIKGQSPVFIEHVHENGAAWRAGVRALDTLCKVNGVLVNHMDHKEVVLLFKSCSRFVALTLMSPVEELISECSAPAPPPMPLLSSHSRQASTYSQRVYQFLNRPELAAQPIGVMNNNANRRLSSTTVANIAPLMDRTNSCRSTASLFTSQLQQQQQQQQQPNLARQDSTEDQATKQLVDKRMAICICCRNSIDQNAVDPQQPRQQQQPTMTTCSQCQFRYRTGQELAYRKVNPDQSRQLHGSLRDSIARHLAAAADSQQPGSRLARGSPLGKQDKPGVVFCSPLGGGKHPGNNIQGKDSPEIRTASIKSLPVEAGSRSNNGKHLGSAAAGRAAVNIAAPSIIKPQMVNKRVEIIREFIDTERTHTERLRCLDELFYRPLKEAGFVSTEQLRMVFSSHQTLFKIHKQIYRILMSANYDVYSEPLVGSALLEIFEGDLKKRLERASCCFCSAQATNTEILNKLTRRDTKAGEFLAQITSQRMVGRLGIKDLLASCFQRLTKYPLLLENLLKATPQNLPQEDEDDLENYAGGYGASGRHRRRSKSGLSAQQRRARMRAGLDDIDGDDEIGGEDEFDEEEDEDEDEDDDDAETEEDEDEEARQARLGAAEEARRNSRRIMAISLAEEREFIERALLQSRQILVRVNESIRVAIARNRLKEIWKRTDKYPGVPLIDITKQQVVHEGLLTLRLSKRSFDVYVLLLNNYIIILTREGQDKYRLKFFTPEGKSPVSLSSNSSSVSSFMTSGGGSNSNNGSNSTISNSNSSGATLLMTTPHQTVYSPVFVIDEHLTTRDAATDENGFYLLCKRKDDSRIYEFASRSPAERMKWRDKIQWTIERQMGRSHRRASCESTLTKSSSEISANGTIQSHQDNDSASGSTNKRLAPDGGSNSNNNAASGPRTRPPISRPSTPSSEPTKIVGTISYVIDDGIVMPSKMESSRVFVDQAIQVNILDGSTTVKGPQTTITASN